MDASVPARSLSAPELRRFGCTVGGVFLALATVSWWRGHTTAPLVLASLGGALVLPALVAPRLLGPVERAWMRLAAVLGAVNTRILLTVVYVIVVTPIGWLRRLGGDPLRRELGTGASSHWIPRERTPVDPQSYRKQF